MSEDNSQFYVGAADVDITPEEGCALAGSLIERHATAIHDPLFARAMVLQSADTSAAIVALDLLTVTEQLHKRVAAELTDRPGIGADNLLIGASHTHSAPPIDPRIGWPVDDEYVDRVAAAIVKAVREAHGRLQPARMVAGTAEEDTVARNSRLLLKDGTISWHSPSDDEIADTTGPMDPQVTALSFRTDDDDTIGSIFSYGLHANVGHADHRNEVSADYPAAAVARLADRLGGHTIYLQQCCGNVHTTEHGRADYVGEQVAWSVMDALQAADELPAAPLQFATKQLKLPIRDIPAAHLQEIHDYCDHLYDGERRNEIKQYFVRHTEYVRQLKREHRNMQTWLQGIRIGDAAILATPAEMFVELSMEIRQQSPAPITFCIGCCNEFIFYVPTAKAYNTEGGYQCFNGIVSPLAGDIIVKAAAELLHELYDADD